MHIQLTKENADKMLSWSHKSGRSVGELVNIVVTMTEQLEITQETVVTQKPKGDAVPRVKRSKSSWVGNW
jgi:hypothetical protein